MAENFAERWINQSIQYTSDCAELKKSPFNLAYEPEPPPEQDVIPSARWFAHVYTIDAASRIEETKAQITCVFGEILKIDSTKKVNIK